MWRRHVGAIQYETAHGQAESLPRLAPEITWIALAPLTPSQGWKLPRGAPASRDRNIPPHDGGMFWFRWNRLVGS